MAISPTVLIVDDSEVQREYMAAMCRDNGAGDIMLAADGNEALRVLEINKVGFDVLICDLEMPDLDGIELIHILGEQKSKSGLVIVSGHEKSLITAAKVMAQDEGLRVLGTMQKPIPEKRLRAIFRLLKMCKIADSMAQNSPQRTYVSLSASEIKRALIDRQFVLHYQPKINMQDMTLSGVEALVRLQLDDGQLVSPNEFIPVCEKYELIDDLTYEVVRLALAQSQRWCSLGQKINISINISAASFEKC